MNYTVYHSTPEGKHLPEDCPRTGPWPCSPIVKNCAFIMEEAFMVGRCKNLGTQCGSCACSGPCVHEMNPVCEFHAGFIEGWIFAVPPDGPDDEGLDRVHEAAAKFIRLTYPAFPNTNPNNTER